MTLRLLVFGRDGQVATELRRRAGPGLAVEALGRGEADLADPRACAARVAATDADVVVNAAAYTAVDRAESEPALAETVNAAAPGAMARAAAARGLPFVHVSTDYVFDGSGDRPWREDDTPAPLNAYGRSKLAGERAVAAAGGPHAILRTSWVHAAHGANFLRAMLRLAAERETLSVVDDQTGGPTPAAAVADALLVVAAAFRDGRGATGVFHFAGAPCVTWRGFAAEILSQAHGVGLIARRPEVRPIASADWPTPAPRPRNSRLDCARIAAAYGVARPDWRAGVAAILAELRDAAQAQAQETRR